MTLRAKEQRDGGEGGEGSTCVVNFVRNANRLGRTFLLRWHCRLHAGACYSIPRFTTPLTGARNVKAAVPNAKDADPWRQRQ